MHLIGQRGYDEVSKRGLKQIQESLKTKHFVQNWSVKGFGFPCNLRLWEWKIIRIFYFKRKFHIK